MNLISAGGWVPDACTLPTSERPLRLAEFDALFASALRSAELTGPTRARLHLVGDDTLADRVEQLAAAESSCCSFFGFTVTRDELPPDAGAILLDIEVPAAQAEVLSALVERALAVGRSPSATADTEHREEH